MQTLVVFYLSIHEINFSINLFEKVKKIFAIESKQKHDVNFCEVFIHNDGIVCVYKFRFLKSMKVLK